jgi:hypothetical protein
MNKYQAYRERLKQDPHKTAEQRRKTRDRVALHRKKKGGCNATVTPPCNATSPACNATDSPHPFDVITYLAVPKILETKRREVALREKCSAAYERILSGPDVEFPAESAGGLHSSPANQGRSFVSGEPCLRTPEVIEREWHSIWGEGDEH